MGLQTASHQVNEPALADLVLIEGSASLAWPSALARTGTLRDLTDAVHALCTMYGGHPCLIDAALDRGDEPRLNDWLGEAAAGFTDERSHLTTLVAASGPLPSTPGQAQTEAAIAAQRHALDMLAHSDRAGCAIGAATALILDWHATRPIVDRIAYHVGIDLPACTLPTLAPSSSADASVNRARLFGARQLLAQQRGLWRLLEARSEARAAH